MAWTTPKTFASLDVLTAAELNTHLRDNLQYLHDQLIGSSQSGVDFTPVLRNEGQAAIAVTNAYSTYTRRAQQITYQARVIGAAASAGTGIIQLDLPVQAVAVDNLMIGTMTFIDASVANTHYVAAAYLDTSYTPHRVYGIRDIVAADTGMATQLATDDIVSVLVTYEAA